MRTKKPVSKNRVPHVAEATLSFAVSRDCRRELEWSGLGAEKMRQRCGGRRIGEVECSDLHDLRHL
jgi:hypothetical protein